jgi:hypothetical protein
MSLRLNRVDAVTLGVFGLTAVVTAASYARLPPVIATHFDAHGTPNGWMPRGLGAWIALGIGAFSWAVVRFSGYLAPEEKRKPLERAPLAAMGLLVAAFICVVQLLVLWVAVTPGADLTQPLVAAMGGLSIGLGVLLPRFPPNPIVGIRTRSTLSSPEVWEKTNRVAGRAFLVGGVVIIAASLVGGPVGVVVAIASMLGAAIAASVYGAVISKRA